MAKAVNFNSFLCHLAKAAELPEGTFACVLANADRILALVTAGRAAEATQAPDTGAPQIGRAHV